MPEDGGIGNKGMQTRDEKPSHSLANHFGHEDIVAGNLNVDIGGERGSAGFEVAKMAIEGGEGCACTDNAKVDGAATRVAKAALGGIH